MKLLHIETKSKYVLFCIGSLLQKYGIPRILQKETTTKQTQRIALLRNNTCILNLEVEARALDGIRANLTVGNGDMLGMYGIAL